MAADRVGTVLGQPTYAELADLIAVQRWQLAALDAVKACPAWAAKDPQGYGAWAASVFDASAAMTTVLDAADAQLALVPDVIRSVTPVEAGAWFQPNMWNQVLTAAQPFHALVATFGQKSGCTWTPGPPPQPTASDFDLSVYQWTGKALNAATFGGSTLLIALAVLLLAQHGGSR